MPEYTLRGDDVFQRVQSNLEHAPDWMPATVRTHFLTLRTEVVDRMREAIEPNRYTGELSDSVAGEFDDGGYTLKVGPTAMRGQYDGGVLLELGTRPHRAPWAPIAAWADFRGLPAFPIWYGIQVRGTAAHPFLNRTLDASEPQIVEAGRRMVEDAANNILFGTGKMGIAP